MVIRYRSLRDENRSMSAMPLERRLALKASVAMGHDQNAIKRLSTLTWHEMRGDLPGTNLLGKGVHCDPIELLERQAPMTTSQPDEITVHITRHLGAPLGMCVHEIVGNLRIQVSRSD